MTSEGTGGGIPAIVITLLAWIPLTIFAAWLTREASRRWGDRERFQRVLRKAQNSETADNARAGGRILVSTCIVLWGTLLAVWSLLIDRIVQGWVSPNLGPPYSAVSEWGFLGSLGIALIGGLFMVSTCWYSRPSFLIPPFLRFDPGLLLVRRARSAGLDSKIDTLYSAADEKRKIRHEGKASPW